MPELIEVELYRRALDTLVGGEVERVDLMDPHYLRPKGADPTALDAVVGMRLTSTSRVGKLLLATFSADYSSAGSGGGEMTLGLRFGMTGRLVIDGVGPIERLEYSSSRNNRDWDRVVIQLGGRDVALNDPRRLGSIDLDPDTARLGIDAMLINATELESQLASRTASIKSLLLNQSIIAGLGNLLVDEILWTAAIDPTRPAGSLSAREYRALHRAIGTVVTDLTKRGGSHTGDLFPERSNGGVCPKDDALLGRRTVGGRTTWWCPAHQR